MDNTSNGEGLNLDHSPAPKNKQYSNKLIIMVVVFIVAVALSFWAGYSFSNQKRTNSDSDSQAKLLFVMKGDVLVKENQLTIVDEEIEWFTDRPNRDAGRMTTQNFMNLWRESGFNSVPPNAAFSNLSAVVELSNPSLDGDSITFDFVVTSGELRDGLLENTSLFVDTIPTPVNGQITDAVTQASANDGLCWHDQAPWQVMGIVTYIADTMTCDQRDQIMAQLFDRVELKSYDFSYHITSDHPQPGTDWLCAGQVRPFNDVSPWQLENANCDPSDATLASSFGFEIVGQTSLAN